MLGLELSHRDGYTSASGIGLVRAIQLVVEPKIWERSVLRMSKYFGRHGRDKNSANFGNDSNPSRGYMAWLNWGGDSGKAWADRLVNKDNLSKSTIKNPRRRQNTSSFRSDLLTQFIDTGKRHEGTPILAQTFPNNCRVEFVVDRYENTALIVYIQTIGKGCLRKGYAKTTMENILRVVDKHQLRTELSVESFGKMNENDLSKFYASLGFEFTGEYDNFDAPIMLRNNPVEISINRFLRRFPRKWWYSDNDWRQMVDELKSQYDNPDNHYRGEFQLDEWSLESLDSILASDKLQDLLESRGAPMIGLSGDWGSTAFGIGDTQIIMHYGKPVELHDYVLVEEEDDATDYTWSLLEFQGSIDQDTDNAVYEVLKTEPAEHYLEKMMPEEYAESLQGLDDEPLQFPQLSNPKVAKKVIRDSKGRKIPQKYLTGYKGDDLQERIGEIEDRRDEYQAALDKYGDEDNFPQKVHDKLDRPFKTDKGIKTKKSTYTDEADERGFTGSFAEKAKKATEYYREKAKERGEKDTKGKIPVSILKDVYGKGYRAWSSSGHRPGTTAEQWGHARVNSFLVGGKTFFHPSADKKLAEKLPKYIQAAIKKKRVWKG